MAPPPRSSITGILCLHPSAASSSSVCCSVKPMMAKLERCTRLLLRVHRSNFAIIGFTEQPTLEELAALGCKHNIPVMEDLGGGAMIPLRALGVNESGVMESLRAGADLITYSGDKMLGGPQAGLLSGREDLIKRVRSNPLFRALRVDKLAHAALET